MKKLALAALLSAATTLPAMAADYIVDTQGAHASINFKVSHLGYSYVIGRFNKFSGNFSYDANKVADSKIMINIDTTSVDSNHAERDKHIRNDDFLDVNKFGSAKFVSSKVEDLGNDKLKVTGTLTLQGMDKEIVIDAVKIGEGKDPWGGYRVGFEGSTKIAMKDFGYKMDFGDITFDLHIEGKRQ
ncbi:YceI family protein [Thalassotalea euphylliae]|uniref:YceI family protein n=1 Tax=Thalassotalea euphylliae TaxID=1655234 RepID=A0A3E0TMX1_9GAMM|nr:YceI family protein [Thalassotalea euphylliae]REL25931.1 YceI family protein [Thalassotalea euphylliae]